MGVLAEVVRAKGLSSTAGRACAPALERFAGVNQKSLAEVIERARAKLTGAALDFTEGRTDRAVSELTRAVNLYQPLLAGLPQPPAGGDLLRRELLRAVDEVGGLALLRETELPPEATKALAEAEALFRVTAAQVLGRALANVEVAQLRVQGASPREVAVSALAGIRRAFEVGTVQDTAEGSHLHVGAAGPHIESLGALIRTELPAHAAQLEPLKEMRFLRDALAGTPRAQILPKLSRRLDEQTSRLEGLEILFSNLEDVAPAPTPGGLVDDHQALLRAVGHRDDSFTASLAGSAREDAIRSATARWNEGRLTRAQTLFDQLPSFRENSTLKIAMRIAERMEGQGEPGIVKLVPLARGVYRRRKLSIGTLETERWLVATPGGLRVAGRKHKNAPWEVRLPTKAEDLLGGEVNQLNWALSRIPVLAKESTRANPLSLGDDWQLRATPFGFEELKAASVSGRLSVADARRLCQFVLLNRQIPKGAWPIDATWDGPVIDIEKGHRYVPRPSVREFQKEVALAIKLGLPMEARAREILLETAAVFDDPLRGGAEAFNDDMVAWPMGAEMLARVSAACDALDQAEGTVPTVNEARWLYRRALEWAYDTKADPNLEALYKRLRGISLQEWARRRD